MPVEIERKFLVDKSKMPGCIVGIPIAQGYLNSDPERTVRIRLYGEEAFITIKGHTDEKGLSRLEFEYPIPVAEAYPLLDLCEPGLILKNRFIMIHKGKTWEIDKFSKDNEGLIIAEIELSSEDEAFDLPDWVTKEVTGDPKYYNSNLAFHPYKEWPVEENIKSPTPKSSEWYYKEGMDLMAQIYDNFNALDKVWFQNEPAVAMHHTLGRHLRNHCKMWELKWTPELIDGVDHSPNHPDAISSRVIKDFQASLKQFPVGATKVEE